MAALARPLLAIALVALNLRTVLAALGAAGTLIEEELDGGGAILGAVSSLSALLLAAGAPLSVWLVRRLPVDTVVTGAIVATALSLGLLSITTPVTIWAAAFLGGTAAGVLGALLPALVRSLLPLRLEIGIGMMIAATAGGLALASVVVGAGIQLWGTWVPGTLFLAGVACVAVLFSRVRRHVAPTTRPENAPAITSALRLGWVQALIAFLGIQSFILFAQIAWLAPSLIGGAGAAPATAGAMLGVLSGLQVVTGITAPLVARRRHGTGAVVIVASLLSLAGTLALLAVVRAGVDQRWVLPAVALLALGHGASFATANFAVARMSGSITDAALVGGAVMLVSQAVGALGPWGFGLVRDRADGYGSSWAVLAVLGAVQVVAACWLAVAAARHRAASVAAEPADVR